LHGLSTAIAGLEAPLADGFERTPIKTPGAPPDDGGFGDTPIGHDQELHRNTAADAHPACRRGKIGFDLSDDRGGSIHVLESNPPKPLPPRPGSPRWERSSVLAPATWPLPMPATSVSLEDAVPEDGDGIREERGTEVPATDCMGSDGFLEAILLFARSVLLLCADRVGASSGFGFTDLVEPGGSITEWKYGTGGPHLFII